MDQEFTCSVCEEVGPDEDARWCPHEGRDFCEDCFEEGHFECCVCGETDCASIQHNMVVIFELESISGKADPQAGTYRVTDRPYYGGPIIGPGSFYGWAIERIADLPDGADAGGYEAGHLCRECQAKVVSRLTPLEPSGSPSAQSA